MELIDRQALIEHLKIHCDGCGEALHCAYEAPTVDAVEVVKCKECVGRPFWEKDHNGVPVCVLSGLYVRSENDFCPYGERKDGDGNG